MAFDGIAWRAAPLTGKGAYLAGDAATSDALFNALIAAYARERIYARLVTTHGWPRFEQEDPSGAQSTDWEPKVEDLTVRTTIWQNDLWVSDTFTHATAVLAYSTDEVSRQTTLAARLTATDTTPTTVNGSDISYGVNEATEGSGSGAINTMICSVALGALTLSDNITLALQIQTPYVTARLHWLIVFLEVRD